MNQNHEDPRVYEGRALSQAIQLLQYGKASTPDGIPAEAIQSVTNQCPELFFAHSKPAPEGRKEYF